MDTVSQLRLEVQLGNPYPLHAGASSKAFLAFLSAEEIELYLAQHHLDPVTEKTIVDPEALRLELAAIKRRGYATSQGERQVGAASIAAPVFDHDGHVIAVLSAAGPLSRFKPRMADCAGRLLAAAGRVSAHLGYPAA